MKPERLVVYAQRASMGTAFVAAAALWARLLRGPQPWQGAVLVLAGLAMLAHGLLLTTDWRDATAHQVDAEQARSRRAGVSPEPRDRRHRTLRRTGTISSVAGAAFLIGAVLILVEA